MQLMVQIPSNRFDRSVLAAAQEADVLFHVEHSVLNTLTIRLTSYEWNASKYPFLFVFVLFSVADCFIFYFKGNLFELLRRFLDLPNSCSVLPNVPSIWIHLREITEATFRKFILIFSLLSFC